MPHPKSTNITSTTPHHQQPRTASRPKHVAGPSAFANQLAHAVKGAKLSRPDVQVTPVVSATQPTAGQAPTAPATGDANRQPDTLPGSASDPASAFAQLRALRRRAA